MIPKSSRFKCCRCGYFKKRPGKCVVCHKVADFDGGEGSTPSRSAKPKKTAQACAVTLGWTGGVNGASHQSNSRDYAGGIKPDSRGGESKAASAL